MNLSALMDAPVSSELKAAVAVKALIFLRPMPRFVQFDFLPAVVHGTTLLFPGGNVYHPAWATMPGTINISV